MTRAYKIGIVGKAAVIAALMGGSSLSFAQDAAPMVAAPVQQAPVAAPQATPSVTPPAAVPMFPTENDVVNAAAAEEAATEAASKRPAAAATKAAAKPRAATPVRATASAAPAPTTTTDTFSEPSTESSTDVAPAPVDVIDTAGTTVEDTTAIAPVEESFATRDTGISNEDMTLFGGIAAALAAIGLGAAFASRRRRRVVTNQRADMVNSTPEYVAPAPMNVAPGFQQFAASPAPQRVIQRAPIMTRPDMPVTDPLFSTPVSAGPITDPLFAPRNAVEKPITDPLFAKHDRFAGRAPTTSAPTREPELVN